MSAESSSLGSYFFKPACGFLPYRFRDESVGYPEQSVVTNLSGCYSSSSGPTSGRPAALHICTGESGTCWFLFQTRRDIKMSMFVLLQGRISAYFVHRYGFSRSCSVVTFTGDNPGRSCPPGTVAQCWLVVCFVQQSTQRDTF